MRGPLVLDMPRHCVDWRPRLLLPNGPGPKTLGELQDGPEAESEKPSTLNPKRLNLNPIRLKPAKMEAGLRPIGIDQVEGPQATVIRAQGLRRSGSVDPHNYRYIHSIYTCPY